MVCSITQSEQTVVCSVNNQLVQYWTYDIHQNLPLGMMFLLIMGKN